MASATLLFTLLVASLIFNLAYSGYTTVSSAELAHVTHIVPKELPSNSNMPPPCESPIYCYGLLLHTVQTAGIYPDSKTFVDMKLKINSSIVLEKFDEFLIKTDYRPCSHEILNFINLYFDPPGSEFEDWVPNDWKSELKLYEKINDRKIKTWASELNLIWKKLGRKMKDDVKEHPDLYSIIPVDNAVIVPGGRFREFYYWDSYWIIRGLLHSEMYDTVRGMLANFISIVDRYGFIPNGGRVYYLMRSQPPFLLPMVDSYLEFTNDYHFLKNNIGILEKEFQFWMNNHTVKVKQNGKEYTLCVYRDSSSGPRPESYREDILSGQYIKDEEKDDFYSQLKSAAESGWDFSSRWFIHGSCGNKGNLTDIKIKSIVPVDLNAIIYMNAKLLAKYFKLLNDVEKSNYYTKIADDWLEAVTAVLWRPEVGVWLDYDLINNVKRDYFFPSNLVPLWTECYPNDTKDDYIENAVKYLKKIGLKRFQTGLPASLDHSGEQWDYPNAWPPSQHMIIVGLDKTNNIHAKELAFDLAEKWVNSNYKAYYEDIEKPMYEKYDAVLEGGTGGGGEYSLQLGFGWTNGVILDLVHIYGDRLYIKSDKNSTAPLNKLPFTNSGITAFNNNFGHLVTLLLAFGATITAGCIGAIVYTIRHSPNPRIDRSKYTKIPGNLN